MKILLATYGSRGDVQPMIALTLGLKSMGHEVWLAAPPEKQAWAETMKCPFFPLGSNLTRFIDTLHRVYSPITLIQSIPFLKREINLQFDCLPRIASRMDLLIGSSLVAALPTLSARFAIPYRFIAFTPHMFPSRYHPHPVFKHHHLPKWHNQISWKIAALLDRFATAAEINRYRKNFKLPAINNAWRHIMGSHVIVASDPAISAVPPDVIEPSYQQTGYMHLKQPSQTNDRLEHFLAGGPAPIYAGFGSMPKRDQMESTATIIKAARKKGIRAVIGRFWDAPSPDIDNRDIFFINKYPHLDLFGRMAAIIHHGGAGTTATAAFCGVPQIVVPHILDQYYWGRHIWLKKLGPPPIERAKLTVQNLAASIDACLDDHTIQNNAQRVGREIRTTDGVSSTALAILKSL